MALYIIFTIDWENKEKIGFFDDLATVDLWDYGACFANIWLFEAWKKKRDDIHREIYWPIHSFCEDVQRTSNKIHSRESVDAQACLDTLEREFCIYVADTNATIGGVKGPFLYHKTMRAFNTWYYDLMYPWKAHEEMKCTDEYKERARERKRSFFYVIALVGIALSLMYLVKAT